jgi:hypothetical protein
LNGRKHDRNEHTDDGRYDKDLNQCEPRAAGIFSISEYQQLGTSVESV